MTRKLLIVFLLMVFSVGVALTIRTPDAPRAKAVQLAPAPEPGIHIIDVHSGDGAKKLQLRTETQTDGASQYEISVDGKTLYTETLGAGASLFLPENAWDPTNTYVFFGKKDIAGRNYFVLSGAGGPVIDVGAVWNEKKIPFAIREATGWASGTLLIIYTSKPDGSKGPAFWFEIPSTAIIQLWN
jgi:hypothetical protein